MSDREVVEVGSGFLLVEESFKSTVSLILEIPWRAIGVCKLSKNPWHRYSASHPHGSIHMDGKTSLELPFLTI